MADEPRIELRAVAGRVGPVQLQSRRCNVIVVKRPRLGRIVLEPSVFARVGDARALPGGW